MPKYRLLTESELKDFEKEFVSYLVVNGIDAADWQRIKTKDPAKAGQILDLFSDVVFEKILRQTQFIINPLDGHVFSFEYGPEEAMLLIAHYSPDQMLRPEGKQLDMELIKSWGRPLQMERQIKAYAKSRETELFNMLSAGCVIEKGEIHHYYSECYMQQVQ